MIFLWIKHQLETDSITSGVCGHIEFSVLDASNTTLHTAIGTKRCIGGKSPGKARIEDQVAQQLTIAPKAMDRAASVRVSANCG